MRFVIAPLAAAFLIAAVPPGYTFTNTVPPNVPGSAVPTVVASPIPPPTPHVVRPPQERMPAPQYFSRDDYPAAAQGTGAHGLVRVTLTVDPAGRVVLCAVGQSSGWAALDQATCNILRRRARYIPAMDSTGNPVAGNIVQEVTWRS